MIKQILLSGINPKTKTQWQFSRVYFRGAKEYTIENKMEGRKDFSVQDSSTNFSEILKTFGGLAERNNLQEMR